MYIYVYKSIYLPVLSRIDNEIMYTKVFFNFYINEALLNTKYIHYKKSWKLWQFKYGDYL